VYKVSVDFDGFAEGVVGSGVVGEFRFLGFGDWGAWWVSGWVMWDGRKDLGGGCLQESC
jgi:hypothetical protein